MSYYLRVVVSIIFLCCHIFGVAQTSKKSLDEIDNLLDSSRVASNNLKFEKSFSFAEESLKLSEKFNYQNGIAWSYFQMGQAQSLLSNYNKAMDFLNLSENKNQVAKDQFLQYEIHRIKGRIYGNLELYDKAVVQLKKGLKIIPSTKRTQDEKKYLEVLINENLYVTYNMLNKLDSAYQYMNANKYLLKNVEATYAKTSQTSLYTFLGNYFSNLNEVDSASYYFQLSDDFAKENQIHYTNFNDQYWADFLFKQNKKDSAILLYKRAAENLEELKNLAPLPELYTKIVEYFESIGEEEMARTYKVKSLEIEKLLTDNKFQVIQTELKSVEKDRDRKLGILKIAQYSILGIIILISIYLIYFFKFLKPRISKLKNESKDSAEAILKNENSKLAKIEIAKSDEDKNRQFEDLIELAKENNPGFLARFQDIYPEFMRSLLEIQPNLHPSELTLCAYIYLNFTTKEIANFTFTSPRTVQTRKYNLRKKLQIPTEEDLYIWMRKLSC